MAETNESGPFSDILAGGCSYADPPDCSLRTRTWFQSDRSFRTVVWSRQLSLALVWLAWFGLTCAYFKCHGLQLFFTIINLNRGVLMERFLETVCHIPHSP